jgi:hypothetical protein
VIEEQLDELDRHRATVMVANPHYLARFTPTRLAVSPLYRPQHDSLGTMTPVEKRQRRYLNDKAAKAGLSEAPPPLRRGGKKISDEDVLPSLVAYVHKAKREGLSRTKAVGRWVTEKGAQLRGASLDAKVARLMRKMRG